ncbi:ABC transporter permease [Mesorhizobium shangrilense]|uniref:ABC transporter permease n=1 Tax=Mesorhizobium shangrilense TaxID=460060 RepID=A0ABV2DRF3_9HYPH
MMSLKPTFGANTISRFLLTRSISGAGLVFVVCLATFIAVTLLPGDAANFVSGRSASPERLAEVRERLNLNDPVAQRFLRWGLKAVQGDLGPALTSPRPVSEIITPRLRNSLILAGIAATLLVPLAVATGALAGALAGGGMDRSLSVISLVLLSMPEFFLGTLLAYWLGVKWHLFPPIALFDAAQGPWSNPAVLVLPCLTLVITNLGYPARIIRANVAEAMSGRVVLTARLNGIPEGRIVWKYALRNCLAPGIQVISLTLLYLLGGIIVVENVFQFPGIGTLAVEATQQRDLNVVLGLVATITVIYALVMLLTDTLIILVTPKLRTLRF